MNSYISKWHKELEIFSKIKSLLILEGDVLDSYQYPQEGSTPKGSILRLSEYLHFFFKDSGYQNLDDALADKQSQLCCVGTHRQPLGGTGSADDTKTLAEAIA